MSPPSEHRVSSCGLTTTSFFLSYCDAVYEGENIAMQAENHLHHHYQMFKRKIFKRASVFSFFFSPFQLCVTLAANGWRMARYSNLAVWQVQHTPWVNQCLRMLELEKNITGSLLLYCYGCRPLCEYAFLLCYSVDSCNVKNERKVV